MRWQLRRGVLSPPSAVMPGSSWWRAVNESLLRDTTEAALLFTGESGAPRTTGVRHWVMSMRHPSPRAWYRAHNASIVAGHLQNRHLVAGEMLLERFFMDVALLRVLYAHSLLARPRLALGRLGPLGRFFGDPRRRAANIFLSMQNVLPDRSCPTGIPFRERGSTWCWPRRTISAGSSTTVSSHPVSNRCTGLRRTTSTSPGCPISAPSGLRSTPGPSNIGTSGGRADLGSGLLSLAPCRVLRSREPAPT